MNNHPCFSKCMAKKYGRIHLPVAPICNIKCIYCDKTTSCVNESRPGLSNTILKPIEAYEFFKEQYKDKNYLSVVGIAGPGDPLANFENTIKTFNLIKNDYPEINLCLSTNGTSFPKYYKELKNIGIKYVTITINTLNVNTATKIYEYANIDNMFLENFEAGKKIIEKQNETLEILKEDSYFHIKINTVYIQGINNKEILSICSKAKEIGADLYNLIPCIKTSNTINKFQDINQKEFNDLKQKCNSIVPVMTHSSIIIIQLLPVYGFYGEEHFQ